MGGGDQSSADPEVPVSGTANRIHFFCSTVPHYTATKSEAGAAGFLDMPSWRRRLFHVSIFKRCGLLLRGSRASWGAARESLWERHLEGACEPRQHRATDRAR